MSVIEKGDEGKQTLKFHYVKSTQFRVIHADGVLGGPTPGGFIQMALYSERIALPQMTEHEVSAEGVLSEPMSISGKDGLVREMDIGIMMTRGVAQEIRDWLSELLGEIDSAENGKE